MRNFVFFIGMKNRIKDCFKKVKKLKNVTKFKMADNNLYKEKFYYIYIFIPLTYNKTYVGI